MRLSTDCSRVFYSDHGSHAAPSASVCSQQDSDVIQANARLAQLSIHDFFAALGQFTNAEQRYGK